MAVSLADQLQIWGFDSDFIIFSDGSFGFGLELSPLDVSCWDDARIDTLACRLGMLLNGLPEGIDLQFVQDIGTGNDRLITENEKLRLPESGSTVEALHASRVAKLRRDEGAGAIPKHGLKAFVRRSPASALVERPRLFSRQARFMKLSEERLQRELNATAQVLDEMARAFLSVDLKATPLKERDIAELVYRQWNPARPVDLSGYDPDDVRSALLFTDVGIYETGFSLGNLHHKVVSLKLLPDQTFASMARVLRELPFDSRLFLSIQVPNQQKELASLQTQRRLAFSMARGKRTGVSDLDSEAKLEDLETLLGQMIAQGEKVFHAGLNVLLRSTNEDALHDQVAETLVKIRELSGAEAMEETIASFDVFSELAIPNARAKERSKRLKTSNLADLLPIFGPWAGHERPRVLLKSTQGSLVAFDPFSKELSNYNQIITGGSGSGKSFLTNLLLLQMLKEAPRVFIVDIGGSYRKLCHNLSGQNIPLSLDEAVSINPFDLAAGETIPSNHKIKFLVGLVEMMTKEEDETRLGRLERAEIEEAILALYQGGKRPNLSALRALLLEHKDEDIRRYGKILTPWCGNTPFGQMVDRPTTIELQRSIVAFDLKGLETYPDLQAVCLYIITDFVWREIQKDRSTMKFLVFDECWKLLESPAGAAFIGEVFRTFRKYYASAVAISQNIDDFAKSRVANAVLPNTSIKWVLMQKGADQARLKEVLQLNDTEMAAISFLHQERGQYSQAFLMAEDKHSIVAVEPTPLEYWIATTDPRDLAAFERHAQVNPSKPQLAMLSELAQKYPAGVVAGHEVT